MLAKLLSKWVYHPWLGPDPSSGLNRAMFELKVQFAGRLQSLPATDNKKTT